MPYWNIVRAGVAVAAGTLMAFAMCAAGCANETPRGTISHGSATAEGTAATAAPDTALRLDPGTPLMTAPVAKRLRVRLAVLGLKTAPVQISGNRVVADIPQDQQARIRADLRTGRLDILLADTASDPLKDVVADTKGFKKTTEQVLGPKGMTTLHLLSAEPSQRAPLLALLKQKVGRGAVIGPHHTESGAGVRSYITQPGRLIRGEHVLTVGADKREGSPMLRATFTPSATAGLRWHIRRGTRFLLYVDNNVISAVTPKALGEGSTLDFPLSPSQGPLSQGPLSQGPLSQSKDVAKSIETRMHGLCLSHQTKVLP